MAILIQQDYAQLNDERGTRAKVRPQDIKSGTYYGQLQLRGSILVIKDNLNTASGYIAYGSSMSTIPTSPTTGTGIYQDYRGIFGNSGGTPQFYLQSSDGKAYAGGGAVVLDENGITLDDTNANQNRIRFIDDINGRLGEIVAGGNEIWFHSYDPAPSLTSPMYKFSFGGDETGDSPIVTVTWAQLCAIRAYIGSGDAIAHETQTLTVGGTAPTFKMKDTTASAKSLLVTVDANLATFEEAAGTDILVMDLVNAAVYLSDTSNADMTIGLTINQGANDNQIFALKSSDVAHGVTTLAETDTFGYITKFSGTDGGVSFVGLNDTAAVGVRIAGVATTANTTHTTGGLGAVIIDGFLKSGTGVASLGADANILAVRDNGTTRFMLDADGDSHQDVGTAWTNFDEHDDLALLNLMSAHVTRQDDPLREHFSAWLEQSRDDLERLKLVTFNADGHHFINWSRMQMLQVGALRQIGERLERLEREHHH